MSAPKRFVSGSVISPGFRGMKGCGKKPNVEKQADGLRDDKGKEKPKRKCHHSFALGGKVKKMEKCLPFT